VKLARELQEFAGRIGHEFACPELLLRALTHGSVSSATRPDNQRLEFLGDRVLGLVMAEALLSADESASEGQLAPRYNALVRKEACAAVAEEIGLGAVLKLGRSEMLTGGRRKQALLGDAMEAVIAAVYLDGGFEAARKLVLRLWQGRIENVEADARDPKTALQEWAQARRMAPPAYVEIGRSGPDHAPVFSIEARLDNGASAKAEAASKRKAELAAAQALLNAVSGNLRFEFTLKHSENSKRPQHISVSSASTHCRDPTISRNALRRPTSPLAMAFGGDWGLSAERIGNGVRTPVNDHSPR
jgi:ribonuclease-3